MKILDKTNFLAGRQDGRPADDFSPRPFFFSLLTRSNVPQGAFPAAGLLRSPWQSSRSTRITRSVCVCVCVCVCGVCVCVCPQGFVRAPGSGLIKKQSRGKKHREMSFCVA